MRDFTIKSYRMLIAALKDAGYAFQTFEEYLGKPSEGKAVMLRHDVDELSKNALKIAEAEYELGVQSTFFFRIVKQSNDSEIIRRIVAMGHSIGYHYEDLALADGDCEKAIKSFGQNLAYFRTYYPVKVACMHGSSSSKYDNRLLWQHCQLSDYGLIGEPYLSLDFDEVFYLTDTGYAWDGGKFATRDIVVNDHGLKFHTTQQVVDCIKDGAFPEKCMILAHTLWSDNLFQWMWLHIREFVRNNVKRMSRNSRLVAKVYNGLVKSYWKR